LITEFSTLSLIRR
jgi:hypothetical protein